MQAKSCPAIVFCLYVCTSFLFLSGPGPELEEREIVTLKKVIFSVIFFAFRRKSVVQPLVKLCIFRFFAGTLKILWVCPTSYACLKRASHEENMLDAPFKKSDD